MVSSSLPATPSLLIKLLVTSPIRPVTNPLTSSRKAALSSTMVGESAKSPPPYFVPFSMPVCLSSNIMPTPTAFPTTSKNLRPAWMPPSSLLPPISAFETTPATTFFYNPLLTPRRRNLLWIFTVPATVVKSPSPNLKSPTRFLRRPIFIKTTPLSPPVTSNKSTGPPGAPKFLSPGKSPATAKFSKTKLLFLFIAPGKLFISAAPKIKK